MQSNMIIVFSIALFFCVSSIQAGTGKPKVITAPCCPTKLCYHVNILPDEKMEFTIVETECFCGPEVGDNCMKTYRDIEFAISKLHRAYDFAPSTNQAAPVPAPVPIPAPMPAPVPGPADVMTPVQQCCPTRLCTNIAYQPLPHRNKLELIIALIPTTCSCSNSPGISCLDSFEKIEQATRTFEGTKYIMGF